MHPGVAQGAHALEPLRRIVVATATPILARMPQALVAVDALGARLLVSRWASTRQRQQPNPNGQFTRAVGEIRHKHGRGTQCGGAVGGGDVFMCVGLFLETGGW